MKKWLLLMALTITLPAYAAPSPKLPLWAAVSAPRVVVPEISAIDFPLTFTLLNASPREVKVDLRTVRVFVNNRQVENSALFAAYTGFGPQRALPPGANTDFTCRTGELFARPGFYVVRWESESFRAEPFSFYVVSDRAKQDDAGGATTLARAIRERLPQGWTVTYRSEDNGLGAYIKVSRRAPTLFKPVYLPSSGGFRKHSDVLAPFELTLRVEEFVSPSAFAVLKEENAETQKRIETVYAEMKLWHYNTKFGDFMARTPEQKAQLARYKALRSALHRLPEFYVREASFSRSLPPWRANEGAPLGSENYTRVRDEAVRKECADVCAQIEALLSRYETAPAKATE